MSIPYMPLYVADFEADTAHLTLEEDGAYNRLLRLCWRTPGCSIPADDAWIQRRMRVDIETYHRVVKPILDEFFRVEKSRAFQPRQVSEHARITETHEKRAQAGRKGGRPAKSLNNSETDESRAKAGPKPAESNQNQSQTVKGEAKASPKKTTTGTRLPEDWVLPAEWGQWALDEGWPEAVIRLEAEKFADFWHSKPGKDGRKADWQATWRNWIRNSKSPKAIHGGGYGSRPSRGAEQLNAFIAGARGTS